ncbi:MAG: FAD-dependent oxidoreductase [Spirochaetota bacterium]|mgnify:CR=1 FL=1
MTYVKEPERDVPVKYDVDVVVAGGGTAGVAAAVCAGRMGLRTVMVEQSCAPGGLVTQLGWSNDFTNKGGFTREFFELLERDGVMVRNKTMCNYDQFRVTPYLDTFLAAANVRVLYRATVANVIQNDGTVSGVFIETKEGRIAVKARVVIDATGDGDAAAQAGAKFTKGRAKDGAMQAISLSHTFINYTAGTISMEDIAKEVRDTSPDFMLPYVHGTWKNQTGTKSTMTNGTMHVCGYDPVSAEGISDALIALRAQAVDVFNALKKTTSMRDIEFGPFMPLPGIRESRRITCDYTVTKDDTVRGARFDDGLFTVTQPIDIHKCTEAEPCIIVEKVTPYHIPYRSLLPRGIENLMVVGRCIGGEHEALASYRIIADCFAMGEAAAIAAQQVAKGARSLRAVDVGTVTAEMEHRGYSR